MGTHTLIGRRLARITVGYDAPDGVACELAGRGILMTHVARFCCFAVAVLSLTLCAPGAMADGLVSELKLGALAHDPPNLWARFQEEQSAVDANVEMLFHPLGVVLGGELRPAIGATLNTRGETSKGYVDLRWQAPIGSMAFIALGMGAAVHTGELTPVPGRKALGSRVLFHPSVEIGVNLDAHNNLSVFFDHMSNWNTQQYNEGMDTLGLRYGHRF